MQIYNNAIRPKNRDVSARRRKMQDKGKIPWTYIAPAIVVVIIVVGVAYVQSSSGTSSILTTASGNYNFPYPCSGQGSLLLHIHPWLRIIVDGRNITLPADIGGTTSCEQPVHTHDTSGIIHIESTTNTNYTLSDFFKVWAATYSYVVINNTKAPIVFNSTDILGFKADQTHSVTLLVDGQKSTASESLVLNTVDYCNTSNSVSVSSPCYATAQGNPYYTGGYPYGTGHTIVIEYK